MSVIALYSIITFFSTAYVWFILIIITKAKKSVRVIHDLKEATSFLYKSSFEERSEKNKFMITPAMASTAYVPDALSDIPMHSTIPLRSFIRCLVFRVSILKLFPETRISPTDEDL
ncbi:hypothetical protein BDZ45DRAFT_747446 [Acephala macrosclerotiorum]|nr:hypothetical protein BDZ45DRAFT_747446 [Acephala macrosclerotiorum]